MKSVLVAALLAAAALAPGVAHADPYYDYAGGCDFATVNDTTPGGPFGGQESWNGIVWAHVVPVDRYGVPTGAPVAATCELRINDVSRGTVLDAGSGTGAVAGAGRLTFTASVADLIQVCSVVTIGSVTQTRCSSFSPAPVCPYLVCGDGGLLDQVDSVFTQLDPAFCAGLAAAAPAVDALPSADQLYVDPASGDTYAGGRTAADLIWDCPPYVGQ